MRGHRAMDYNTQKGNQSLQYTRLLFGNARTVVNDITGTDTYDTFAEMSSQQAAFLVPQIRLFKTLPKEQKDIDNFVDNEFLALDARAYRKYVSEITPDVDLTFEYTSQKGNKHKLDIPLGIEFFWPAADK